MNSFLLAALGAFVVFVGIILMVVTVAAGSVQGGGAATLVVAGIATAMLVTRRHMRPLLAGVTGGITIAVGYGLARAFFPRQLGSFDSIAGYRLSEPLGYWNAVGILAVLGTLLAVGFAARARTVMGRAFGSAVPVLLVPGVYFTFGRGPWVALGLGLALAIALDERRLQIISTCLLLLPFVGMAVWLSSREPDSEPTCSADSPVLQRRGDTLPLPPCASCWSRVFGTSCSGCPKEISAQS